MTEWLSVHIHTGVLKREVGFRGTHSRLWALAQLCGSSEALASHPVSMGFHLFLYKLKKKRCNLRQLVRGWDGYSRIKLGVGSLTSAQRSATVSSSHLLHKNGSDDKEIALSLIEGFSVFKQICTSQLFSAGSASSKELGMRGPEAAGAFGGLWGLLSWPEGPEDFPQPRHSSRSSLWSPASLLDPGYYFLVFMAHASGLEHTVLISPIDV